MFKQNISFEVWGGESGKYRLRDNQGKPLENSPEETCKRVALAIADTEQEDKKNFYYEPFNSEIQEIVKRKQKFILLNIPTEKIVWENDKLLVIGF